MKPITPTGKASWKAFMRDWLYFPMAVQMVWNVLMLQVLFPGMILVVLIVRMRNLLRVNMRQWYTALCIQAVAGGIC